MNVNVSEVHWDSTEGMSERTGLSALKLLALLALLCLAALLDCSAVSLSPPPNSVAAQSSPVWPARCLMLANTRTVRYSLECGKANSRQRGSPQAGGGSSELNRNWSQEAKSKLLGRYL